MDLRDKARKHVEGYVHPAHKDDYVAGTKPGKIVASAILQDGDVWTGNRHHNIIHEIATVTGVRPVKGEQGFWTEDGWFLRRESALEIAFTHGQAEPGKTMNKRQLFSEDLW